MCCINPREYTKNAIFGVPFMINEETMKIRLLFLLLLSGFVLCAHAQSLYTPGKITEGSLASYYCYAETKLVWKIRNVENTDTTDIMYYKNGEVAKNYQPSGKALFSNDDLIELFCETLTSTELSLIKNKAAYFLQVNVVCDSHGNANEVGFGFRNDDPVLTRLLPDRFYDLEQKLKRLLKVNLSTEDIQIKNIKYFAIIDYRQIN